MLTEFFCCNQKMAFPADQELDSWLSVDLGGRMYNDYTDFFSFAIGLMLFNDCFTVVPLGSTPLGSLHTIKKHITLIWKDRLKTAL